MALWVLLNNILHKVKIGWRNFKVFVLKMMSLVLALVFAMSFSTLPVVCIICYVLC